MHLPKWMTGFGAQVIAGLIIGLILGLIAAANDITWLSETLSWVGSAYVQLLKLLIPPLVFTAVVTSIANLRKVTNAARLAWQTLLWFAITAFFSVIIGIIVGTVMQPGANSSVDASSAAEPSGSGSWLGFLNTVIPSNFFGLGVKVSETSASVNFNVLQILVISLLIGVAAIKAGKAAEPFLQFSASFLEVIQVVLWWIIRLAPIGSAALIGKAVATYGWEALGNLGQFVLAIYVGLALVIFVLYPAVLAVNKVPVGGFFRRVWPVTTLGFVTRSSMGVMPVNQRTVEESMGVPREYAAFAMPLGATTKMDGCASIYPAIAALFVAQFYGLDLGATDYLLIVIVAVLGSAATAGTTGATVMLTLTLSTLGLPLAGVGLLLAIEPIIDMGRTAVNVTGQAVVAAIVAKREGILDEKIWDAAEDGAPAPQRG
ncbi:sodium:proton antiporter [Corynebacterium sp. NML98-0116]|uniref:Dicarboxylate/amino acid:cation symporter n=1 Tax=Corynebacterium lipophilum TaxID=2804918 RepID=A0AAW5HS47_9CORY|nr:MULTISPECIES: dicarboxylate/amino acid:cation symporter [Corynebacterium]AOX06481.1 sodium:proton antiporter [Corynebacterium sp. NML98-0116]MCO6394308.1 dicarboxylate/amino acid:cation symporter [Corynebacterium lipophilum]MCZ2116970.1 dicarboxylate/amino acid:cation symporter [Corynebacterium lipophilum]MDK8243997.1 dicarboxylate/amino acid:cation symporter [Corynebacterium sp. UMB10321]OFT28777.1 sodium:proton antiporter [Corynebacterium sp. HMSC08D02]